MAVSIRVGDEVQVTSGAGTSSATPVRGKVISVDREKGLVTVEGYNLRTKHLKRTAQTPKGGRLKREAPFPAARVMLVAEDGKPVRLARAERKDGRIVRKPGNPGNGRS
jgi:large subunit ribosomal protein L24